MNIHHVLALTCLGFGVCALACGNNGTLFNDVLAPAAGGSTNLDTEATTPSDVTEPSPNAPPEGEPTSPSETDALGSDTPVLVTPGPPPPTAVEPTPEPVVAGPTIVSVSPEDGVGGVQADASIAIRFSEPMDHASTEAAYQSEGAPSSSVTFSWNDDSTELSVVPDAPLEYSSGSDPELVEARRINYFVSASAAASDGRTLTRPYEFSFSLLRQISISEFAVQDRSLSGNFRSDDTYGEGNCAEDAINMCVGDVRVSRQNQEYKGFISFEIGDLPEAITALSATLSLDVDGTSGNPFGGLGELMIEHTRFDSIGLEAFDADALEVLGPIAEAAATGAQLSADVSASVAADIVAAAGSDLARSQFRFRFQDATDNDSASDAILSGWDTQTLDVTYLIP